jgi:hypothetical protein
MSDCSLQSTSEVIKDSFERNKDWGYEAGFYNKTEVEHDERHTGFAG